MAGRMRRRHPAPADRAPSHRHPAGWWAVSLPAPGRRPVGNRESVARAGAGGCSPSMAAPPAAAVHELAPTTQLQGGGRCPGDGRCPAAECAGARRRPACTRDATPALCRHRGWRIAQIARLSVSLAQCHERPRAHREAADPAMFLEGLGAALAGSGGLTLPTGPGRDDAGGPDSAAGKTVFGRGRDSDSDRGCAELPTLTGNPAGVASQLTRCGCSLAFPRRRETRSCRRR